MMLAHLQKAPVPPSQRSELAVPESLDRAIMMCLAKQPEERPARAEILGRLLEAATTLAPGPRKTRRVGGIPTSPKALFTWTTMPRGPRLECGGRVDRSLEVGIILGIDTVNSGQRIGVPANGRAAL